MNGSMIAFGPVPSRRLGRSLGVNNIPAKTCSYACVYCQLGRTDTMRIQRQRFYGCDRVVAEVCAKTEAARRQGETVDYVTWVADGEPTLDSHLGHELGAAKALGLPVAVITNASLLNDPCVRQELALADWVSAKVDAAEEGIWRIINRPHGRLRLEPILDGIVAFAGDFAGHLVTETMLIRGLNDGEAEVRAVAEFLARLQPAIAYLAVPTRPPCEAWVRCPSEEGVNRAYQMVSEVVPKVECLTGYEGSDFGLTGDVEEDLLRITAVHPMRDDAVAEFLGRAGQDHSVVDRLVDSGQWVPTVYRGSTYYLRRLNR